MWISVSKSVNPHLKVIRMKMVKFRTANCIQIITEKTAILLHYIRDHRFAGATINKDFHFPIFSYFKTDESQRWLKCQKSERHPLNRHQISLKRVLWKRISTYSSKLRRKETKITNPMDKIFLLFPIPFPLRL